MLYHNDIDAYNADHLCSPTSVAIFTPLKGDGLGQKRSTGILSSLGGAKRIISKSVKTVKQARDEKSLQNVHSMSPARTKRPKAQGGHYMNTTEASRLLITSA
jgi:hypothetical protein